MCLLKTLVGILRGMVVNEEIQNWSKGRENVTADHTAIIRTSVSDFLPKAQGLSKKSSLKNSKKLRLGGGSEKTSLPSMKGLLYS